MNQKDKEKLEKTMKEQNPGENVVFDMGDGHKLFISKAPTDPEQKKIWDRRMLRIAIAQLIDDGATCAECGHRYGNVDDFMARNPSGNQKKFLFVCQSCMPSYREKGGKLD